MLVAPNALVSERFKHMLQSKACKITTHMVVEVCMPWCASLADDWKIKCAWPSKKCNGCPECFRELFVVNASEAPPPRPRCLNKILTFSLRCMCTCRYCINSCDNLARSMHAFDVFQILKCLNECVVTLHINVHTHQQPLHFSV